jgi:hypothetical protein
MGLGLARFTIGTVIVGIDTNTNETLQVYIRGPIYLYLKTNLD